MELVLKGGNNC